MLYEHDVVFKPEVHNVSQRRQKRTESPTAMGDVHRNGVQTGRENMLAGRRRHKDKQTCSSQYSAPLRQGHKSHFATAKTMSAYAVPLGLEAGLLGQYRPTIGGN